MGGTTVVCGVKAEIAEPDLKKPDEGFLGTIGCSLSFSPHWTCFIFSAECWSSGNVSSAIQTWPAIRPSPGIIRAVIWDPSIVRLPDSRKFVDAWYIAVYHHFYTPRAKMIPLQTLVISSGKAVWTLYVDATCINYDGNVFDATLIAMVSALFNGEPRSYILFFPILTCGWMFSVRLPKAIYDEGLGQTICHREPKTPLTINSLPLSMSFGIFNSYVAILCLFIHIVWKVPGQDTYSSRSNRIWRTAIGQHGYNCYRGRIHVWGWATKYHPIWFGNRKSFIKVDI